MSDNNAPANIHYNKLFFLSLIGLYFAQGLPSGLFAKALPAIMREHEVSLELIGLLKLLAMPWFFKFLWAPIVDQSANRRRWIFSLQLSCIPLLALLAFLPLPLLLGDLLVVMLALLLIINTLSATQDIATDGLAASTLKESELGFANTIQVAAYKMGLIIGGSSLLIAIDKIGWQNSVFLLCGLLTLSLLPLFLDKHTGTHNVKTGREKSVNILGALFSYIKQADIVLWLGVLMTCKISDSLGSGMLSPMLVDKGMSLSQIGSMQTIISGVGLSGSPLIKIKDGNIAVSGMLIGADRHKCFNFDTTDKDKQCISSPVGVVSPFDERTLQSLQTYRKLTHQRQSPIIKSFTYNGLKYQVATFEDAKKWLALFNITAPVSKEYSHYLYSAKPVNEFSIKVYTFYITGIKSPNSIEQMLQQWQILEVSSANSLMTKLTNDRNKVFE